MINRSIGYYAAMPFERAGRVCVCLQRARDHTMHCIPLLALFLSASLSLSLLLTAIFGPSTPNKCMQTMFEHKHGKKPRRHTRTSGRCTATTATPSPPGRRRRRRRRYSCRPVGGDGGGNSGRGRWWLDAVHGPQGGRQHQQHAAARANRAIHVAHVPRARWRCVEKKTLVVLCVCVCVDVDGACTKPLRNVF